ncbi:MAG TPA: hypothetical protein PLJ78_02820 [Anaerolineae bacterium]|nr:hypothetical protein [Anaerolineae bacterium]HQK12859.1 hypothetical protein [Anaerolineae bacterium]
MTHSKRSNITSGLILILIGSILLAFQVFPGLSAWFNFTFSWPMIIILIALGMLVIGLLSGAPDMAIPACIIGGIGGILYFQNAGRLTWESWGYLWTLVPGFAGVGNVIAGLVNWKRKQIGDGLESILVSAVLFAIFGSLFGNLLGYFPFKMYLPFALIALGVFLFIRELVRPTKRTER